MNSMPSFPHSEFEERLRFEMLLTEVSARFVSATSESIDAEIVSAQKQIVQELGLDRSTLAQLQEPDRFVVTHCWAVPGLEPIPGIVVEEIPWFVSAVGSGKEVHFAHIDDLPEERRERRRFAVALGLALRWAGK
jgi:formate hydrogenlyase transcriptional activator